MLIQIDKSLIESIKLQQDTLTETSIEVLALNNLAHASREGTHIIFGTIPVLEFLMKFELLDQSARKTYNSISLKFSMLGSYQSLVNSYVIVKDNTCKFLNNSKMDKQFFEVPVSYFSRLESISSTDFLCEDISDFKFYSKLAKKFIKENPTTYNLTLSLNFINGGGDRSSSNYQLVLESKDKLSLVIADSDKKLPSGNVGNTLSSLRTVFQKYSTSKITELIALSVREKENLIPPSIYGLCANTSIRETIEKLKSIEQSEEHFEKLLYIDLKDGLKAGKLRSNQDLFAYYRDMLEEVPGLILCPFEELEDTDYIIRGIGNLVDNFVTNILDDGLDKQLKTKLEIDNLNPNIIKELEQKIEVKNRLFQNMPEFINQVIVDLCKKIISWGCSTSQLNSTAG